MSENQKFKTGLDIVYDIISKSTVHEIKRRSDYLIRQLHNDFGRLLLKMTVLFSDDQELMKEQDKTIFRIEGIECYQKFRGSGSRWIFIWAGANGC